MKCGDRKKERENRRAREIIKGWGKIVLKYI